MCFFWIIPLVEQCFLAASLILLETLSISLVYGSAFVVTIHLWDHYMGCTHERSADIVTVTDQQPHMVTTARHRPPMLVTSLVNHTWRLQPRPVSCSGYVGHFDIMSLILWVWRLRSVKSSQVSQLSFSPLDSLILEEVLDKPALWGHERIEFGPRRWIYVSRTHFHISLHWHCLPWWQTFPILSCSILQKHVALLVQQSRGVVVVIFITLHTHHTDPTIQLW